jgi:hypothetical protein
MGRLCFKNIITPVHVLILKNIVPACLQNTGALQCASRLFMQNFHSASRQQDTNFIWLVASRMQTGYFVLHGR